MKRRFLNEPRAILIAAVITGLFVIAAAIIQRRDTSPTLESVATSTLFLSVASPTPVVTISSQTTSSEQSISNKPTAPSPLPAQLQTLESTNTSASAGTSTSTTQSSVRITVEGVGKANPNQTDAALRRKSAVLAAELDAKRKYAEWVNGAEIEAVTVYTNGVVTIDEIRQTVTAKITAPAQAKQTFDETRGIATIILEWVVFVQQP